MVVACDCKGWCVLRRGLEIIGTVCGFGGGAGGGGGGVAWSGANVTAVCWCVVSCLHTCCGLQFYRFKIQIRLRTSAFKNLKSM